MPRNVTVRELRQARRLSQFSSAGVLIGGTGCLVVFLLLDASGDTPPIAEIAYILASALVSAGLVALLLGRVTLQESRLGLQETIEGTIESSLLPMRELVQADCQVDYRWHCLVSMPDSDDPYPDYAFQQITIEKDLSKFPNELRFVCVAAMGDDALAAYSDDSRYQFRWLIDETLDPANRALFDIVRVSIDGQELRGRELARRGVVRRREVAYGTPKTARDGQRHTLSFEVIVRKHVGNDRRVRIRTQLFSTTLGADFRCTLSDNLSMTAVWVSTSEVTSLGPMQPVSGEGTLISGLPCSLRVRYKTPLQVGSSVAFHLERQ